MTEHGIELLDDPVATELLESTLPAHLAYTWTDGTPRVVPIWFHWTGAKRYFGEKGGSDWVAHFPVDMQMSRVAVRPTWVSIIDFATRLPSALSV